MENFIEGNVGREAEEKHYTTKNGDEASFMKFSIMAKLESGEETWVSVACFSKTLCNAARSISVGQKIRAYGDVTAKEYNGKNYYNLKANKLEDALTGEDLTLRPSADFEARLLDLEAKVEMLMGGRKDKTSPLEPMPSIDLDSIPF